MAINDTEFDKLIADSIVNFGRDTRRAFAKVYTEDSKRGAPVWKTGFPILDAGIKSMRTGTGIVGGVENCGKTNFSNCLYLGILDNTEDVLVADLILDDTQEVRIHQLAAAKGRLPMDIIALPGLLPEDSNDRIRRKEAYQSIIDEYGQKLEIIDSSSWNDKGAFLDRIEVYLTKLRMAYPSKKIWVNLDAFDDVALPAGVKEDERVKYTSYKLKAIANRLGVEAPFFIMAIKHFNKGWRGRGASMDAFKGHSTLSYDAKLAITCYSEMGELGNAAQIFFYPEEGNYETKNPVFEVEFKKNKVGSLKNQRVFYLQWPAQYFCVEATQEQQLMFGNMVADQLGVKK